MKYLIHSFLLHLLAGYYWIQSGMASKQKKRKKERKKKYSMDDL
jgi:hypothetical protein